MLKTLIKLLQVNHHLAALIILPPRELKNGHQHTGINTPQYAKNSYKASPNKPSLVALIILPPGNLKNGHHSATRESEKWAPTYWDKHPQKNV